MDQITVFQKLQTTKVLGALDLASLKPVVTVSADNIITAIAQLWEVVTEQRQMIEIMDKEANRKRTEQDVKIQNLQSDVESRLHQESRKRQQEDDRLRVDLQKMRDELAALLNSLRADFGSLEGNLSTSLDATLAQLKLSVAQAQQRTTEHDKRIHETETMAQSTKGALLSTDQKIDAEVDKLQKLVSRLYSAWDLDPAQVAAALAEQRATELLLATPPFEAILSKVAACDDKAASAKREVGAVNAGLQDVTRRTTICEAELQKLKSLPERVSTVNQELRMLVDLECGRLRERIENLSKDRPSKGPIVQPTGDSGEFGRFAEGIASQMGTLAERVAELESLMAQKANLSDLDDIARKVDLASLEERIRALLAKSQSKPSAPAPTTPAHPTKDPATAAALLALKDDVDGIGRRLTAVEKDWYAAKEVLATRDDVRDASLETLKAAERALNHVYEELRKMIRAYQGTMPNKADGTAGRFRCLSCNRDAGPLSEAVRERLSKSQFPPSTTLMSRENRDSPPRLPGFKATVPGTRDGAPMTSSRRKLQNYYDWLQVRETDGEPRSVTPPRTMWLGAQSGGGGPGRQSGDHGSEDPEAIGADGKYYTGVVSRPTSANGFRPKSAPLHKVEKDEAPQ
jgi:hypothetical protein